MALKGVRQTEKHKRNKVLARMGYKHSFETKNKIKVKMRGLFSGKKHPNWKGGITPEKDRIRSGIEYRLWCGSVFARDNWTCQKYGTRGGRLVAHHLLNFSNHPELRSAINNGTTLSEKAHKEFHKKYGKRNNTKEQIISFLSS